MALGSSGGASDVTQSDDLSLGIQPRCWRFVRGIGIGFISLVALYFLTDFLRSVYTDWLWFQSLALTSVFTKVILTKITLYLAGGIIASLVSYYCFRLTWKSSWGDSVLPVSPVLRWWIHHALVIGSFITGLVIVLIFANVLASRWETAIRFWYATPFGASDPEFGKDVGFYVFVLPALHLLQGWVFGLLLATIVSSMGFFLLIYSARGINPVINHQAKILIGLLSAALMVSIAAGHLLDTYETLFSDSGAVTGTTYADVNARIPALYLLTGVALLSATMMLYALKTESLGRFLRTLGGAFALWAITGILAGILWPVVVQRLAVEPSEFQRERTYIERNIDWTRRGYGLSQIKEVPFNVRTDTLATDILKNPETISNIRLWDPRPLRDVLNQIQHLRLYYNFLDVDVDRYVIDGRYRQVLLGTRELFQNGLDDTAQNWINRKLIYTHGYGLVMASATDFTSTGQPNLLLKDVPMVGTFKVEQPRIYYGESFGLNPPPVLAQSRIAGELSDDEVIVNTKELQFDRPADTPEGLPIFLDRYQGSGGVPLSSFLRRFAFSWEFNDVNFIFSRELKTESRVLYRRSIRNRVSMIAPWLELDDDPYMVLSDKHLYWIQDAYLTTDHFPYSRITQVIESSGDNARSRTVFDRPLNYIRNSVKIVVDAYDGSIRFYAMESEKPDPILETWRNAFPDLFIPIDQMPSAIRKHIRYPEELLETQADTFLQYHMTDPREFFLKEDQWQLGEEVIGESVPDGGSGDRTGRRVVDPYYVIMKLPGEEHEEFVLILPFTPQDKPNLIAWMAARSDGEHYGEVLAFEFPKDRIFNGPAQIEARIDNDPSISEQFTLWDQSGSRVIRGNLLVIPIGESLLYAEPIYLQADSLAFPELKRVILATDMDVVMAETLDKAVRALIDGPSTTNRPTNPEESRIDPDNLRSLNEQLKSALEALTREAESLGDSLQLLEQLAGEAAP